MLVDGIEMKFGKRFATSSSFNVWWWQTAWGMTCSRPLSRTPNTIPVTLYSLATNVTPNVTTRFPFSSSLPSSSCWWRCTDLVYHLHTVYEIRCLLFISFEISLLPVSFSNVFFLLFFFFYLLCFGGGASTSTAGLRRQSFFGIAITNTHTTSYVYEYKTCFSRLNFPENYYCFCLCRKIRPKLETIASLAFVSLQDERSEPRENMPRAPGFDETRKKNANTRKNWNERKYSTFWCGCCRCYVEFVFYLINTMLFLPAGGLIRTQTNAVAL